MVTAGLEETLDLSDDRSILLVSRRSRIWIRSRQNPNGHGSQSKTAYDTRLGEEDSGFRRLLLLSKAGLESTRVRMPSNFVLIDCDGLHPTLLSSLGSD